MLKGSSSVAIDCYAAVLCVLDGIEKNLLLIIFTKGGDYLNTSDMCQLSDTLATLIMRFEFFQISILDYKLYIDDSKTPIVLTTEADYEPYLAYHPFYLIEDAAFDNIRYTKAIRIITPKAPNQRGD